MLEKLDKVEGRYEELNNLLSDPGVMADRDRYRELTKEHFELEPIIACFREWKKADSDLRESKEIIDTSKDQELKELALLEYDSLKTRTDELYQNLMILLMPKDPNDAKNVILEIRAGTGGDEAALFVGDLLNMYTRYVESKRWRIELLSTSDSTVGGYKEVIARIEGNGAYSLFKYERGVHRVQRVPATETQGRIHTSTVTVAVLPEAEEVDIEILDKDLRIDVFRSSGPGGQSVNTTDSAVRVTHLPTGMVVSCQDEKSQLKNKNKALGVLRARLLDLKQAEADAERRDARRTQIGSGERSEKIRTYNYPQSRVTDHRIGLTVYQLDTVLKGSLDMLVEPLVAHYRAEALKGEAQS
ncbi:MAG: peptide chain release factor 1 [Bdellovibrionota bacterium]